MTTALDLKFEKAGADKMEILDGKDLGAIISEAKENGFAEIEKTAHPKICIGFACAEGFDEYLKVILGCPHSHSRGATPQ